MNRQEFIEKLNNEFADYQSSEIRVVTRILIQIEEIKTRLDKLETTERGDG